MSENPASPFQVLIKNSSGRSKKAKYALIALAVLVPSLALIGAIVYYAAGEEISDALGIHSETVFQAQGASEGDVTALLGGTDTVDVEVLGGHHSECPGLPRSLFTVSPGEVHDDDFAIHFSGIGTRSGTVGTCEQQLDKGYSVCAIYNPYDGKWKRIR